jgi:hypothetical protein
MSRLPQYSYSRIAPLIAAAAFVAACNPPVTKISALVEYDDTWQLESLLIRSRGEPRVLKAAHDVTLVIPDDWAGAAVTFEMWGLVTDATKKAYAKIDVTPVLDDTIDATLSLRLLDCSTPCTVGANRCDGDAGVATCLDVEGCGVWSQPVACDAQLPFCSDGNCAATCTDECSVGATQCDGTGATKSCGQADADSCLEWKPSVACGAGQTCTAGACSASPMMCDNPVANWHKETPAVSPSPRFDAKMVYDGARREIVMFGGSNGDTTYAETWTWNGATWKRKNPATSPTLRQGFAMAYDAARQNVMLFGGDGQNDTWTWNGTTWKQEVYAWPSQLSIPLRFLGVRCSSSTSCHVLAVPNLDLERGELD